MPSQQPRRRQRREQLESMLAAGQARLERARSRSLVVDTMVGVIRRERPVAVGILAASLAFRLFALAVPRPAGVPWTALVPGACLFAAGFQGFTLTVSVYFAPRAARASTVYGSLGVAVVLLVSLFLFARWPRPFQYWRKLRSW